MNLYLILYLLGLQTPKYCFQCKTFKYHFPSTKEYRKCPLFTKIKKEDIEIDYKYCFRNCNCELYFRDSLFLNP